MKNKAMNLDQGYDEEDSTDNAADEANEGEVVNVKPPKKKKKRKGMAPVNGDGQGAPKKAASKMSRLDFMMDHKGLKIE